MKERNIKSKKKVLSDSKSDWGNGATDISPFPHKQKKGTSEPQLDPNKRTTDPQHPLEYYQGKDVGESIRGERARKRMLRE